MLIKTCDICMAQGNVVEKVNKCLEMYHGGTIFFDELDKMMKFDEKILREFTDYISTFISKKDVHTIASGEFGMCLHNYKLPVDIVVQGGLRNGDKILDLSKFIEPGKEYLFLDDSYFSGKTADVIQAEVEKCGGKFIGCYVIYDGSKEPVHEIQSVYRYYDYH